MLVWLNFCFYCVVIFWFVVLGVLGVVFYVLVWIFVDKVRDDYSVVYVKCFKLIYSLLFWFDWLLVCVVSFGYLVIGNFNKGISCWLKYVFDFLVSNWKVVM